MRRGPDRQIFTKHRMPDLIERERKNGDEPTHQYHHRTRGKRESPREPAFTAGPWPRNRRVKHRRRDDSVQSDQDEQMWPGERARISTIVDVHRDVPVDPYERETLKDAQGDRRDHVTTREPAPPLDPVLSARCETGRGSPHLRHRGCSACSGAELWPSEFRVTGHTATGRRTDWAPACRRTRSRNWVPSRKARRQARPVRRSPW